MVLIALVPLLTSTLGSLLAETAAGRLAGFGSDKGKSAINKITKKLFNKTLFKKKLSDLSVDDFNQQFNELLTNGLEEFSKTVLEELKPLFPSDQLEEPLRITIGQVTNTLNQIESKNDKILSLVENALDTKQEFISEQCLSFTWYDNLRKEINYANLHNLKLVEPIQNQLTEFEKNFERILEKLTLIERWVELGFKANQEGQEKIPKLSKNIETEIAFKFIEIDQLLKTITLNTLNHAKASLLELEDSKLQQTELTKKQNRLRKIENELAKLPTIEIEISNTKQEIQQFCENKKYENAEKKIDELIKKHKAYLTQTDYEFLRNNRIEKFHKTPLRTVEISTLDQLEKLCKKRIPLVNTIGWETFGYSNTGTTITGLGLYGQGLSSLPESISSLQNLRELRLGSNALSSLPESLGSLQNLRELYLYKNQLSSLPESLGSLQNLQELWLRYNALSSLPESLSSLKNLRELRLGSNALSSLPESLGSLQKLQILDLNNNQLSSLPESLGSLQNLQKLLIWDNQLSSLPESLGSLKNLRMLDLRRNQLSSLPESLGSLKNLRKLDLRRNQLSSLPENVKDALRKLEKNGCRIYR